MCWVYLYYQGSLMLRNIAGGSRDFHNQLQHSSHAPPLGHLWLITQLLPVILQVWILKAKHFPWSLVLPVPTRPYSFIHFTHAPGKSLSSLRAPAALQMENIDTVPNKTLSILMALQPFMFLFRSQSFGHLKVSSVPIQMVTSPFIFFLQLTLALQISAEAKFTLGIFYNNF